MEKLTAAEVSHTTSSTLDVGEEAVRFDNPLLPKTRSELALPLVSRDEVIGALTINPLRRPPSATRTSPSSRGWPIDLAGASD